MSNTLIFYSNTIRQDAPTHVIELKREYEMLVMFQLSRPLIKKIKSGCFASPKKALSSNTIFIDKNQDRTSLYCGSTNASTIGSEEGESRLDADLTDDTAVYYNKIIQDKVSRKDKKVKKILETLTKFEEQAITDGYVNKTLYAEFKSLVRKSLALCLLRYEDLRFQQFESICLSILFIVVGKLNLSKKQFLKIANKTFGKKLIKISFIRKARCFASINAICSSY